MQPIYVIYGTESFNTEDLAERTGEALEALGLSAPIKVLDMEDFDHALLPSLHTLIVLTSTYGNGDPPSNAEELHGFLMNDSGPLKGLRYTVCALGDSVYPHFAQCGRDFDQRLEELGADRFVPLQVCDVDYEEPWEAWMEALSQALPRLSFAGGAQAAPVAAPATPPRGHPPGSRRNPYLAEVLHNRALNKPGSTKENRHLVLRLPASVPFELGDSIGIWTQNTPAAVAAVVAAAGLRIQDPVQLDGAALPLGEALARLDLAAIDSRLVTLAAQGAPRSLFAAMQADAALRQRFAARHHVIDLLEQSRARPTAQALVGALKPLAPRLYSVASSRLAHPEEVHLLVSVVRYEMSGRPRTGVFSGQLAAHIRVGDTLPVYVHPSPSFRLCADTEDAVMIGPGTGVAPFRGFLQERRARRASGKSWLFFGDRHAATDFIYEDELRGWLADGTLARLDTAFSRDQAQKIYVQQRMEAAGAELWRWIAGGAVLYLCGDAHQMAPDVTAALIRIIARHGRLSAAAAQAKYAALEAEGRVRLDVY